MLIRKYRERAGLTQAELGEKIGVSVKSILRWEKRLREPRASDLERIAGALGVTVAELLEEDGGEKWKIEVIWEEPEEVDVMDIRGSAPHKATVQIGSEKVGVKVVGHVESEDELDSVLADLRMKAIDALGLQSKWNGIKV